MQPDTVSVFPTSFAQERLWIAEQLAPGTAAYHVPVAVRLVGVLDVDALTRAVQLVVDRHEALRTVFTQVDGRTAQVVLSSVRIQPQLRDLTGPADHDLTRVLEDEATRAFDLERGPLVRVALVRLAVDEHVLALTLHHLVSDMWSCGLLLGEVATAYNAFVAAAVPDLPELTIQYPDFSVWQRDDVEQRRAELLAGWRRRLDGAPPMLDLPTDRARPAAQTFRGAQLAVGLSAPTSATVRRFAREVGATPFMVLLAAFQAVVGRYTGQPDVAVSTGVGTRGPQTEALIGCFINIVVLRTDLTGRPTFGDLVGRARDSTVDALSGQELPFEKLVEELAPRRDLSYNPYSQVMFILQNAPLSVPALSNLDVSVVPTERGAAQCDLNVQLRDESGAYTGFVEYASDLFDETTVARLWTHVVTLLEAALDRPDVPLDNLAMLTGGELARTVAEWNATAADYPQRCLHELFSDQVDRRPDATAVVWTGGELTYRELDARAEALARRLREAGVGPDALVGVLVERSPELVVALLGVLKAGGAYLPLDPDYPEQRLAFMLGDARPVAVVTQPALTDRVGLDGIATVLLDPADALASPPAAPDPAGAAVAPGNLAYVIYTSGSTGRPKGLSVTHRGVVNNVCDLNRLADIGPSDRVLALSPVSFDMSVYEVFGILAAGGSVVVPDSDRAKDPRHWLDLIDRYRVTVWNSAPTLLSAVVDAAGAQTRPDGPRVAFLGGDWIPVTLPDRARAAFPRLRVVSLGGATEASIHSVMFTVDDVDPQWTSIPYGRPMANQQVLIVDEQLRAVSVGVAGELCLSGIGLVRGYLDRPALTAERFVPHPYAGGFAQVPAGARLYRTGDLARYRADGVVELLGRLDHQVKVRGHRVELGEIAAALRQCPGVADAVAAVRRDNDLPGGRLVGYVVPVDAALSSSQLRAHLKRTLPDYMVPDAYVNLDALPLSPNGKVDRAALPAVSDARPTLDAAFVAPRTALEQAIADIWLGVLQLDTVGVRDDFFDLGGQSLLATQVASLLRESFRIDMPLRAVFEAPTIADQAELIARAGRDSAVDVDAIAEVFLQVSRMTEADAQALLDEAADVPA